MPSNYTNLYKNYREEKLNVLWFLNIMLPLILGHNIAHYIPDVETPNSKKCLTYLSHFRIIARWKYEFFKNQTQKRCIIPGEDR